MKRLTAALLTCGIVAGAMLPTVLWIDGATRPGYSLWHHGASQLGLGERAGLQTRNFVLAGILVVGFSIGVRRVLQSGRGANWGPTLLAAAGIGLVVAGIVPTNPALGYPPGEPSIITPSSVVHQVAGLFLFGGLSGAAFVLARAATYRQSELGDLHPDLGPTHHRLRDRRRHRLPARHPRNLATGPGRSTRTPVPARRVRLAHSRRHLPASQRHRAAPATSTGTTQQGLPEPHGIAMKGRKDGQAWYAYRALHRVTRSASEHRISHPLNGSGMDLRPPSGSTEVVSGLPGGHRCSSQSRRSATPPGLSAPGT